MKNAMAIVAVLLAAMLAACSSDGSGNGNGFAARDTTVEYYRVFDIKTAAGAQAVAQAASAGIQRNVKDAVVAMPSDVMATDLPGHFRMAEPGAAAAARTPSCEGASWTAKASPRVRGGDNLNLVACLFPYKSGYHLDMYAVFTRPEGGWLAWPRRLGGAMLGTPEQFTENTMLDVVRTIRTDTHAQVALVEAKPNLQGTPWLEGATTTSGASKP